MEEGKDTLLELIRKDRRYPLQAYIFVFEALSHTVEKIGERRHITGRELLEGIKELALKHFGGLTKLVFSQWNVGSTEDFGEIVFNLVDAGLMGRTELDSKDDFKDGYNFDEVFNIHSKQ